VRFLRALSASFSYFSILPGKTQDGAVDGDAIALLPIVGVVIGGLSGFGAYGVFLLTHSTIATAIVAWILSIALSGAIHVDGFLDCCDGLFAMAAPERRLEIMRDPHHGTYAMVGMAMLGVVWLYALMQIAPAALPLMLAISGGASRVCGAALAGERGVPVAIAVIAIAAGAFGALGRAALIGLALMAALAYAIRWFALQRLGRLSGDCYGAAVVLTEVGLLLAVPYLKLLP